MASTTTTGQRLNKQTLGAGPDHSQAADSAAVWKPASSISASARSIVPIRPSIPTTASTGHPAPGGSAAFRCAAPIPAMPWRRRIASTPWRSAMLRRSSPRRRVDHRNAGGAGRSGRRARPPYPARHPHRHDHGHGKGLLPRARDRRARTASIPASSTTSRTPASPRPSPASWSKRSTAAAGRHPSLHRAVLRQPAGQRPLSPPASSASSPNCATPALASGSRTTSPAPAAWWTASFPRPPTRTARPWQRRWA